MGTTTATCIKHPVPDRVKPSFVIFDIWVRSHAQRWASESPDVKNYKWRLNPVWYRMLYSRTHMATVDVKGLIVSYPSCGAGALHSMSMWCLPTLRVRCAARVNVIEIQWTFHKWTQSSANSTCDKTL